MRVQFLSAIIVAAGLSVSAQSSTTPSQSGAKPPKSLTLTGCVGEEPANAGHYTLRDLNEAAGAAADEQPGDT
ncbi:MAG: hypothetical protein ACRENC_05255 [Gemmatimonadaceae bacterium]